MPTVYREHQTGKGSTGHRTVSPRSPARPPSSHQASVLTSGLGVEELRAHVRSVFVPRVPPVLLVRPIVRVTFVLHAGLVVGVLLVSVPVTPLLVTSRPHEPTKSEIGDLSGTPGPAAAHDRVDPRVPKSHLLFHPLPGASALPPPNTVVNGGNCLNFEEIGVISSVHTGVWWY